MIKLFTLILIFMLGAPVTAHELWINPVSYQIAKEQPIIAKIMNGENFNGVELSFLPGRIARFDVIYQGRTQPVTMRAGDKPALNVASRGDGLYTLVYQSEPSHISYTDRAKFDSFVAHKDLNVPPLPDTGTIEETYTRFSKSLIAVGDGAGKDASVGLESELIALDNPFETDDTLRVRLEYQGVPRGDARVEIFAKAPDGSVNVHTQRTDANGIAVINVKAAHEYMIDAVYLRPAGPNQRADIETLWANLTFAVPAK